ncbi:hypothetical protein B0H17DRAFT_1135939 [Mycena rosella]|uniref:Uncharacterized protein n=1 Tax=Mycena rosella TaxID=1033263 RepID=A0AAD7GH93_MYCRO|nr:hypothetical protein B0H17DRAFT_1135939 [Mycena rosella]
MSHIACDPRSNSATRVDRRTRWAGELTEVPQCRDIPHGCPWIAMRCVGHHSSRHTHRIRLRADGTSDDTRHDNGLRTGGRIQDHSVSRASRFLSGVPQLSSGRCERPRVRCASQSSLQTSGLRIPLPLSLPAPHSVGVVGAPFLWAVALLGRDQLRQGGQDTRMERSWQFLPLNSLPSESRFLVSADA